MNPTRELSLFLEASDLPPFELEHRFHPKRKWRFDIAWPGLKLAVEVHGAVYVKGRHTQGKGFTNDREKMNTALLMGWRVLEVTSAQVRSGQALTWIEEAIQQGVKRA